MTSGVSGTDDVWMNDGGVLLLLNTATGKIVRKEDAGADGTSLALSPDGRILYALGYVSRANEHGKLVRKFNAVTGQLLATRRQSFLSGGTAGLTPVEGGVWITSYLSSVSLLSFRRSQADGPAPRCLASRSTLCHRLPRVYRLRPRRLLAAPELSRHDLPRAYDRIATRNRDLDSKASAQLDAGRSGRPHPRGYPGHKLHVEQGPRRPRTGGLLRLRRGQSAGTLIRHAPGVAKEAATTQR